MTKALRPPNPRAGGFSLVELLVVIGIISLVAATALPNILGFMRGAKIRAAQNAVATALQRARSTSIGKNTQMGVTFVIQDNSTFWIHTEDSIAGVTGGNVGFTRQGVNFATPVAILSTRYTLPQGVEFASAAADCPAVPAFAGDQASLRFDRYGQVALPGTTVAGVTYPAVILNGGSTTVNRIYTPAGDMSICLIDRKTRLGSLVQVARSGRIVRR